MLLVCSLLAMSAVVLFIVELLNQYSSLPHYHFQLCYWSLLESFPHLPLLPFSIHYMALHLFLEICLRCRPLSFPVPLRLFLPILPIQFLPLTLAAPLLYTLLPRITWLYSLGQRVCSCMFAFSALSIWWPFSISLLIRHLGTLPSTFRSLSWGGV